MSSKWLWSWLGRPQSTTSPRTSDVTHFYSLCIVPLLFAAVRRLQNYQYSTERQKGCQNLAPVLVIISGNSLVFSRKSIISTGFYRCDAPHASAPAVVSLPAVEEVLQIWHPDLGEMQAELVVVALLMFFSIRQMWNFQHLGPS